MGLARDLAAVEATLHGRTDIDLFAPVAKNSLFSIPECASLIGRVSTTDPAMVVRLCLQALAIQRSQLEPKMVTAELVATLPPETPGLARPTEGVVREMLGRTTSEVILLGYELTDTSLVELLANAATRGASVIVICDRNRGAIDMVRREWPSSTRRPRIFQDRERADGAPYASMHAKCLLVDGDDLLITSANFTFHGLRGNIEIGVRLSGSPAGEARKVFSHLVEQRILEELE